LTKGLNSSGIIVSPLNMIVRKKIMKKVCILHVIQVSLPAPFVVKARIRVIYIIGPGSVGVSDSSSHNNLCDCPDSRSFPRSSSQREYCNISQNLTQLLYFCGIDQMMASEIKEDEPWFLHLGDNNIIVR
jgi:hypothetical protein